MNSSHHDRHTAELHKMQRAIAGLLIYQDILAGEVGQALVDLLQAIATGDRSQGNALMCLTAYGRFFRALAAENCSWEEYLIVQILQAENPFSLKVQKIATDVSSESLLQPPGTGIATDLPSALIAAVGQDLQSLYTLYTYGCYIPQWVQQVGGKPVCWIESRKLNEKSPLLQDFARLEWGELVTDLARYYQQSGVGIFGKYRALKWQERLLGIAHPDPVRLDDLVGYELQKLTLINNTKSLLAGKPALNILLYGGKGTGKSSLIKGLLNYYPDSQLRLVEVSKSHLINLPLILDRLTDLPQKFIIFVDDLSFEADDEAFKSLKVVLEGSVTARPSNVVVYATSNRRHLVREYFADRPRPQDADEIQMWDTVQEKLSFSDRFGITLTFEPADQPQYLEIVHHLAKSAQLPIDRDELEKRALQWATRHNGRSGRTARQFIDYLLGEVDS
ncbi:ATP-binding protein [Chamaesiphon minutus]|uniref:Putative ATPase (AAA+ superfamily) n=1 Tax=Chamaesiphon minutus (strain ATCC 27169 / PCC 6605) TaxID=1173020 RepID=K9UHI2_CHAP6|nr:ATP-binding protein [Chamaesiphon minutus]AFY94572.1 putative ATPase (AAA+ superfamily) [Chamaesiphon minutus PCC 6605]